MLTFLTPKIKIKKLFRQYTHGMAINVINIRFVSTAGKATFLNGSDRIFGYRGGGAGILVVGPKVCFM